EQGGAVRAHLGRLEELVVVGRGGRAGGGAGGGRQHHRQGRPAHPSRRTHGRHPDGYHNRPAAGWHARLASRPLVRYHGDSPVVRSSPRPVPMPSRPFTLAIVAFWLLTAGWFVARDVLPAWRSGDP